jgi:hypothetical protein
VRELFVHDLLVLGTAQFSVVVELHDSWAHVQFWEEENSKLNGLLWDFGEKRWKGRHRRWAEDLR